MKKFLLSTVLIAFAAFSGFAQSEAPNFQKIAIIPFNLLGYPDAGELAIVQENIEEAFESNELDFHLRKTYKPYIAACMKRTTIIIYN